ncbi:MAG: S41 family peptidase [Ginsengibacter sp.]
MRNKKLQVWLPLLLSLCMVAGMFVGYRIKANMPNRSIFFMQPQRPVQEVLDLIKNNYVDEENIDSLGTVAIQSMLSGLDPHSAFLPASILKSVNEDLQGIFYGIGVEFNIINDTTNVINVLPGSPSFKAGLQIGDQLIRVNDSLIAGNNIDGERLKNLLRGSDGSKVQITIRRQGALKKVDVYRGPIPIYSLDAAYMMTDTTGYIRLNKFSENTYKEFMQAMDKLHKQGMKALILDLRDNGGGVLTEATHIADEFLSGNKLITYTEGAHSPRKDYRCDKEGVFETGTLIILANEGTASASEILIGALQDWDRATIIGRRTFGKGLVQEQYVLGDGSGLRLTVARYYTPLGRSIQKPYDGNIRDYDNDIVNRFKHGEMSSADSIKHTNEKKYTTAAGHIVFAGGGISPDIFVGVDTNSINKEVMKSLLAGTLGRFAYFNYMRRSQNFKKYNSIESFTKNFTVSDSTLYDFKQFALNDSIHINLKDSIVKQQIEKQIKVLTARQIWSTEGFYQANNQYDESVKKAIEFVNTAK